MLKSFRVLLICGMLALAACPDGKNRNNENGGNYPIYPTYPTGPNVPNGGGACGTSIPSQYCTNYNPNTYPNSPYNSQYTNGQNGYGYYNNGYYSPGYSNNVPYGCPSGYQPFQTQGGNYQDPNFQAQNYQAQNFTCMQMAYLQSMYNQYGYTPYYPSAYSWGGGMATGMGPGQTCDPYYAYSCGTNGATCAPMFGQRAGYCVGGSL